MFKTWKIVIFGLLKKGVRVWCFNENLNQNNEKTNLFLGIPVQVLNNQTKDLLVYNSKLSAARAIGTSKSTIRRYIISKKIVIWQIFNYTTKSTYNT
jgi:NUMOD1 domain